MTYTPLGDLVQGRPGIIGFSVDNTGTGAASTVTATVTLPPGVEFRGLESTGLAVKGTKAQPPKVLDLAATDGWACDPTDSGAVCTHPAMVSGDDTHAYLDVDAAPGSQGDVPVTVTISADGLQPVTVTGSRGVQEAGLSTRYAATGALKVTEVGNALLSCPASANGCADARMRRGHSLDDDNWAMTWYDSDTDPSTTASSSATVDLPAGSDVRWAGLYWSGFATGGKEQSLKLRAPGSATYQTVPAERTDLGTERGATLYQSYADVTALVQAGGGGTWWAADPQVRTGSTFYGGWALVVVRGDPGSPADQVTVFDGLSAVTAGGEPQPNVVAARPGGAARIGAVLWEGDAGITGDQISLDGTALTPQGGNRDAKNVADSSAAGAVGPTDTFGTDVDSFLTTFPTSGTPTVTASTQGDTYFVGVLTVSNG